MSFTLFNSLALITSWAWVALRIATSFVWHGRGAAFYHDTLRILRSHNLLFTKIFQSLANSTALQLPPPLRKELTAFTANCPYTTDEIDIECLDKVADKQNIRFDPLPKQAGMIALIFHGVNRETGQHVILKLKRKEIEARLRVACQSIRALYDFMAHWFPQHILIRILHPFMENLEDILDQCDFGREICNLRQARADFAELPCVQIPEVLSPGSGSGSGSGSGTSGTTENPSYILMTCLHGTHTLAPDATKEDRLRYFEYFCRFMCYGFIFNCLQHTDLHAGNILFMEGGIGVLDFGMAFQPSETVHDMILSVMMILFEERPFYEIDFIETFKELVMPPLVRAEIRDVEAVENLCITIATPLLSSIEMDELNVLDTVQRMSALIGRPLVLHRDLYKLLLGMAMMGNNKTILGPEFSDPRAVLAIEKKVLIDIMADAL
jgi:predicted unusual protein kinase regulating ubiquinone biosynthesis (AarF/ABC1/UbiB family)